MNQIAKRVNATGNVYAADIADIQKRQAEIWEQQKDLMETLIKIAGTV
ncbi:MAG: plasmid mobilization relaxosome protein MobC [Deltaproteobacteria bacterium]|nr:plasmid mobilization relaxosome protein MobC [Deltaproteobacteria bacterium]